MIQDITLQYVRTLYSRNADNELMLVNLHKTMTFEVVFSGK